MADVVFVALVVAFFGLAVLLVQACDRIIGPDPAMDPVESDEATNAPAVIDRDAGELAAW